MKISGFTMVRNAGKYYFPIKESIESILPIVDEFIVALGNCDADDNTLHLIESIGSEKIKIFPRVWPEESFVESRIFAEETNFALRKCAGDWCFYLQADEIVHENDLDEIYKACERELSDERVDGLLFEYYHFWGDYKHYLPFHGWYKNEIRIVRNNAGIYSYKDAQSFRKADNLKLNVKEINAHIYHYGWVRPPYAMQNKKKEHDSIHHGIEKAQQQYALKPGEFDYGAMGKIPLFAGTHPKVMDERIQRLDWKEELNYSKKASINRPQFKHEKVKYRIISFLENNFNEGKNFFGYTNWKKIK